MLQKGKLRERVKSGEVDAQDALKALLTLQRQGEVVSEDAIKWLRNFNPARRQQQNTEAPKPQKKQRRKQRRDRKVPLNGGQPALKAGAV